MEMPRNFILCFIKQFLQKQYIFKNLTKHSSILLGFEVANRVLSHLTCSAIKESSVDLVSDIFFTKKELNIINYSAVGSGGGSGGGGGLSPPNNFLTSDFFSKKDSYIIITKVL